MTNTIDVSDLLKSAIDSVDGMQETRKRKFIDLLKLHIPEPVMKFIDIDTCLWQIGNFKLNSVVDPFLISVRIDGVPIIDVSTVFENDEWRMGQPSYRWSEVVLNREYEVIGIDKRNTFRNGTGGFIHEDHKYQQEDFMLALGEATLFAKKIGTYNDNH